MIRYPLLPRLLHCGLLFFQLGSQISLIPCKCLFAWILVPCPWKVNQDGSLSVRLKLSSKLWPRSQTDVES